MYSNASDSLPTPSIVSSETPSGVGCSDARSGSVMGDLQGSWGGEAPTVTPATRTPPPSPVPAGGGRVAWDRENGVVMGLSGLAELVLQERTLASALDDAAGARVPAL